jgi:hypothetical protein
VCGKKLFVAEKEKKCIPTIKTTFLHIVTNIKERKKEKERERKRKKEKERERTRKNEKGRERKRKKEKERERKRNKLFK